MVSVDLVMFFGVLYHLPHPILALQKIASVCMGTILMPALRNSRVELALWVLGQLPISSAIAPKAPPVAAWLSVC